MVTFSLKYKKEEKPFFQSLILCLEQLSAILIHAAFIDLADYLITLQLGHLPVGHC